MLPELAIEQKTIALFSALPDLTVSGAISSAETVKGAETPADKAYLAVAVSAPAWDSYLAPNCSVAISLGLAVRRELSPTGDRLVLLLEAISDILLRLQFSADFVGEAFSCAEFLADGVQLDGGSPPAFDSAANAWTLSRNFTVKGRIPYEEPTS